MNFASSHVYNYAQSDEESFSEDELERGMHLSESDSSDSEQRFLSRCLKSRKKKGRSRDLKARSHSDVPPTSSHNLEPAPRAQKPAAQHRKWRRADTNIVSVRFDKLIAPDNMHAGDPEYCSSCRAVLSHISNVDSSKDSEQIWRCEFCDTVNTVDLMPQEIPSTEDVTFMLTPAPSTQTSGKSGVDESLVVFCIDTSGSMCVTTEVPGKIKLRGSERLEGLQSLNDTHESQYMPGQRHDVTYVSRLQSVQAAVDHQLGEMSKDHPHRRVALVTFSDDVTMVGDGTGLPITLSGDKLNNREEIIRVGTEAPRPQWVCNSRKTLGDKVFELEEKGSTALGPALLVSITMACQVPGSKVIICTDGLANGGLGNLENLEGTEALEQASSFYPEVGNMAKEKGVSVSVISITGTGCRLVELGRVANATGGQVNIVDPMKLTQEFANILSNPIIATRVTATFLLHSGLYFRHEESEESRVVRDIGNVTEDSEITFEFGIRRQPRKDQKTKDGATSPPAGGDASTESDKTTPTSSSSTEGTSTTPDPASAGATPESTTEGATCQPSTESRVLGNLTRLPFQLQLVYTDLEGACALRVLTRSKPVTTDRELAEKDMDVQVLGVHTAQMAANLALEGRYTRSRLQSHAMLKMLSGHKKKNPAKREAYMTFYDNVAPFENEICEAQLSERRLRGYNLSDEEDEDEEDESEEDVPLAEKKGVSFAVMPASTEKEEPQKKKKKKKKAVSLFSRVARARNAECTDEVANMMYQNIAATSKNFKK